MKATHYALFLLLALFGCKDCSNDPSPSGTRPQPTTDGRNTFYCEINGKPYYQKFSGGQPSFPVIIGGADSSSQLVSVDFRAEYSKDFLLFRTFGITKAGIYKIDTASGCAMARFYRDDGCDFFNSRRYNSMSGSITFTRFDFRKGIFSGTFEFKNWLPDSIAYGCDTVRITNGIFDLSL